MHIWLGKTFLGLYNFLNEFPAKYTNLLLFANNLANCSQLIRGSNSLLRESGLSYSCSALQEEGCEETYQRIYSRADPECVYERSLSCDLDWPGYSQISQEERDFPLAYLMTVYTDARTILMRHQLKLNIYLDKSITLLNYSNAPSSEY